MAREMNKIMSQFTHNRHNGILTLNSGSAITCCVRCNRLVIIEVSS